LSKGAYLVLIFWLFGNGEAVLVVGLEGPRKEFFSDLPHGGAEFPDLQLGVIVLP
jgi:hypothetical protein